MPLPSIPRSATVASLALSLLSSLAFGQESEIPRNGYDGDIDLITPVFSKGILPGIDVPDNDRPGSVRFGLTTQYLLNPLVLYQFEEEIGPVVRHRGEMWLGASVDVSRAITVRAVLPLVIQFGSQVPQYAAEGFATGDLDLGMHWSFYRSPTVSLGIRTDIWLPTSRKNFYTGERIPRLHAGFLLKVDAGRVRFTSDLGSMIRFASVETTEDLTLGSELVWNGGFRFTILPDQLYAGISAYSRFGFQEFLSPGETAGEALALIAWQATPSIRLDVGGGRGFTKGYGSTDARGFVQLTFQKIAPARDELEGMGSELSGGNKSDSERGMAFNIREINRPPPETEIVPEEWEEGELARIVSENIVIRDELRFRVGSSELMPESIPTLDYIAKLMNEDARIAHIVIEGHSSEDGDYLNNYRLSVKRSNAIWERLLKQGVHPSRMSFRGMGEVMPAAQAAGEEKDLAASRRAVFHIVRQYEEWESPPDYKLDLRKPWDGQDYTAVQPIWPSDDDLDEEISELARRPQAEEEDTLDDVSFEEEAAEESDDETDFEDFDEDFEELEDEPSTPEETTVAPEDQP